LSPVRSVRFIDRPLVSSTHRRHEVITTRSTPAVMRPDRAYAPSRRANQHIGRADFDSEWRGDMEQIAATRAAPNLVADESAAKAQPILRRRHRGQRAAHSLAASCGCGAHGHVIEQRAMHSRDIADPPVTNLPWWSLFPSIFLFKEGSNCQAVGLQSETSGLILSTSPADRACEAQTPPPS